jgi:hypothetical protein
MLLGILVIACLVGLTGCNNSRRNKAAAAKAAAEKKAAAAEAPAAAPEPAPQDEKKPEPQKKEPANGNGAKAPARQNDKLPREAVGVGANVDAAKRDVASAATSTVKALMLVHGLKTFQPSQDFVRDKLLEPSGRPGEDVKTKITKDDNEEEVVFKTWVVNFRTDPALWNDIVRRDKDAQRDLRATDRQGLAARVVFGLAGLFLVIVGYHRFDEYTQHRYRKWLRAAGAGLVAAVIIGAWLALGGGW